MIILKKAIKSFTKKFFLKSNNKKVITTYPSSQKIVGRVLFSYLADPLLYSEFDERLNGHSNKWDYG